MPPPELVSIVVVQLPLTALVVWLIWHFVIPALLKAKDDIIAEKDKRLEFVRTDKDKQIVFIDDLRKSALEENKELRGRVGQLSEKVGELTNVVRESLEFNGTLVDRLESRNEPIWSGSDRRRRPRKTARTSSRTSADS